MDTEISKPIEKTRIVRSREHTKEEKREQQRRRRKRTRDTKRSDLLRNKSEIVNNKGTEKEEPCSRDQTTAIRTAPKVQSRGAAMVRLAAKKIKLQPSKVCDGPAKPHRFHVAVDRLKEINPDFLEYCSISPIGSGSYGDCYTAKYRGIDVVVKRVKTREPKEDNKRVIREVLHEGEVINALGDYDGLPLLFGVITIKAPICLVLQFHGVQMKRLTLFQAAEKGLIGSQNLCVGIFNKICDTLQYVHAKGFLHNDIKSNNVILEERDTCYFPILIDFGKSKKIQAVNCKLAPRGRKSYLAPEVIAYGIESTASDVFSLGQMLRSVTKQIDLYTIFRKIGKQSCKERAEERITLKEFGAAITTLN